MSGDTLPKNPDYFISHLCELGRQLRTTVIESRNKGRGFSGVARQTRADTIYELDVHVEPVLEEFCRKWSREFPLLLIAEGIAQEGCPEGEACFPIGTPSDKAVFQLIVDPVDGTRELMYDKRSAWVLAGVAPNFGNRTRLSDICVAMQAEIPTSKQSLGDVLWAARGRGAYAVREDVFTGAQKPLAIHPSRAHDLAHGFGSVASFFPGCKTLAAQLLEYIAQGCNGPPHPDQPLLFDDQYISTGGQLYEVMMGHDRFVVDIRQALNRIAGMPPGLCAHPYDLSSMLIAREAGIVITNGQGEQIDGPLDIHTSISWAAYANAAIAGKVEPLIAAFLRMCGSHD